MDSKIGFGMSLIFVEAIMWTMCEFPDSKVNGFGVIWWTDKLFYFGSIEGQAIRRFNIQDYCLLGVAGVHLICKHGGTQERNPVHRDVL